ncbi:MAG TPA: EAL domain-containing protein, partial [Solirubrobacteraceae bacterium]|jgi:diguanylate cyclase (GGDEF)-like protein/PAS domain S-box-containing protein|nr:EAL domain-containing protein [Solirubrobacteraceae bacterium]
MASAAPIIESVAEVSLILALAGTLGCAMWVTSRLNRPRAAARGASDGLHEAEARFDGAFEDAPIGMVIVDLQGRIVRVNRVMCELTGHEPEELLGRSHSELVHPADREAGEAQLRRLIDGEIPSFEAERRYLRAGGEVVWTLLSVTPVRDAENRPVCLMHHVQEIAENGHVELHVSHVVDRDAHTGLYNRRRFEVELERRAAHTGRHGTSAALILVDLDNLGQVNDSFGHARGDELLARVAAGLRAHLRKTDVLARVGGDEFAVIVLDIDHAGARRIAESLLEIVRREGVLPENEAVRATATIGVAQIDPLRPRSAEQLMIDADLAVYEGKCAGRDRIVVRDPDDLAAAQLNETVTWVERIRGALQHDGFVLYEQPLVELCSGRVTRHEILLRMVAGDGEHIPPMSFLPVAERFGLVREIDAWVIRNAIDLIARQARRGRQLQLEVNISGASVTDPDLLATIELEIARAGIDPGSLIFEITETTAIVNMEQARTFAERLAELGCGFALDDFGAGFGSFFYLKHLPFDTLKIDGEFVRGLMSSERDRIMVKAIARVASDLGTETVAEFVGDQATQDLLRSYGVHYAQGYGIGRPQPVTSTWPGAYAEDFDVSAGSAAAPA